MLCRHCEEMPPSRPRGLCWSCYYQPGVRDQYPSTSKYGKRGFGNFHGQVEALAPPTSAPPGSPEKVAILEERAMRRQSLWHPLDAPLGAESRRLGVA